MITLAGSLVQTGDKHIAYVGKAYEHINSQQQKLYLGDYAVYTIEGGNHSIEYLHKDRLGSVVSISNAAGVITNDTGRGFDPFGKPREDNWTDSDGTDNATAASGDLNGFDITSRGFTGHEQLNSVSLTHMNGRVYDYNLGRFLSVDPYIQGTTSQAINPYSYIQNNPLSGVDPSGYYAHVLRALPAIGRALGEGVAKWVASRRVTQAGKVALGATVTAKTIQVVTDTDDFITSRPMMDTWDGEVGGFQPSDPLPNSTPPSAPVPDLRNDTAHDNSASNVPDNSVMYSEGEGNSELQGETTKSKGLIEAERLRDEKLAELDRGSNTKRARVSTVIGVHNPETGEVAVGVKIICPQNRGTCAENNAEDNLTEGVTDPEQLEFTKAIRPRNKDRIDRCDDCTKRYGKEPEGN